jgi:hypothetical protein
VQRATTISETVPYDGALPAGVDEPSDFQRVQEEVITRHTYREYVVSVW